MDIFVQDTEGEYTVESHKSKFECPTCSEKLTYILQGYKMKDRLPEILRVVVQCEKCRYHENNTRSKFG